MICLSSVGSSVRLRSHTHQARRPHSSCGRSVGRPPSTAVRPSPQRTRSEGGPAEGGTPPSVCLSPSLGCWLFLWSSRLLLRQSAGAGWLPQSVRHWADLFLPPAPQGRPPPPPRGAGEVGAQGVWGRPPSPLLRPHPPRGGGGRGAGGAWVRRGIWVVSHTVASEVPSHQSQSRTGRRHAPIPRGFGLGGLFRRGIWDHHQGWTTAATGLGWVGGRSHATRREALPFGMLPAMAPPTRGRHHRLFAPHAGDTLTSSFTWPFWALPFRCALPRVLSAAAVAGVARRRPSGSPSRPSPPPCEAHGGRRSEREEGASFFGLCVIVTLFKGGGGAFVHARTRLSLSAQPGLPLRPSSPPPGPTGGQGEREGGLEGRGSHRAQQQRRTTPPCFVQAPAQHHHQRSGLLQQDTTMAGRDRGMLEGGRGCRCECMAWHVSPDPPLLSSAGRAHLLTPWQFGLRQAGTTTAAVALALLVCGAPSFGWGSPLAGRAWLGPATRRGPPAGWALAGRAPLFSPPPPPHSTDPSVGGTHTHTGHPSIHRRIFRCAPFARGEQWGHSLPPPRCPLGASGGGGDKSVPSQP